MAKTNGTTSVWMETHKDGQYSPLARNIETDVCVIGAGISGLSTAYCLLREGRSVTILDAFHVGGGQTERTTAHLASAIDDRFTEIERMHGEEGSRLAADSHATAIDMIETIVGREKIACDFKRLDGFLFLGEGDSRDILKKESEAAKRAGLLDVQYHPKSPEVGFDMGPCLRFPQQGQFHPMRYLDGLAKACERMGGQIHSHTRVDKVEGGKAAKITTASGALVTAKSVVVATNSPFIDQVVIHTKQAPYRTYAVALLVSRGALATGLYWDTLDPYHYVRLHQDDTGGKDSDLLIVGGEDHKTGQDEHPEKRFEALEKWARRRFPFSGKIAYRWSGQVEEPVDGLAFIGRNPGDYDNVYIATGDSGMGMTHGTIAGLLLTDLIQGKENRWQKLYDPSRKSLRSLGEFIKENTNVAIQYGDWLTGSDVKSPDEINKGQRILASGAA